MSYQVFARKYRPQNFDSVVGQEHITTTLKNAIQQERLAHAYLFVGPRGTGKTSTARIFAKALNCVNGPTVNPCGVCPACVEIANGSSLDVLEFDAASNTQVEKVRELIIENVKYAPTRGKHKLYIVDEVHMLSNSSFNALLKTLEEPPSHVIFLFATTEANKVPLTILSRCQRFDMRRIPAPSIAKQLLYIASEEGVNLTQGAADTIAKGAEGGMRDAESMLDQLVAFCGSEISEQDVLSIFGFTAIETVTELCGFIFNRDSANALAVIYTQAEAGKDLSQLMSDVIEHLRNVLVVQADPESLREELGDEQLAILQEHGAKVPLDRLLDLVEQFASAENRMKWAGDKKLQFEIAIIKAVQTLGQTTLTDVLDALTAMKSGAPLPAPTGRATVATPVKRDRPAPKAGTQAAPASRPSMLGSLKAAIEKPAAPAPKTDAKPEIPAPKTDVSAKAEPRPGEEHPQRENLLIPSATPPRMSEAGSSTSALIPPTAPPVEDVGLSLDLPIVAPVEVLEAPAEQETLIAVEPEPKAAAMEGVTPSAIWPNVIAEVRRKRPLISHWLERGVLVEVSNGQAVLAFPPEEVFAKESVDKPDQRKFIADVLSTFLGTVPVLKVETRAGLNIEPLVIPEPEAKGTVEPEVDFENDPLIQKALEIFKAEIQN